VRLPPEAGLFFVASLALVAGWGGCFCRLLVDLLLRLEERPELLGSSRACTRVYFCLFQHSIYLLLMLKLRRLVFGFPLLDELILGCFQYIESSFHSFCFATSQAFVGLGVPPGIAVLRYTRGMVLLLL